MNKIIQQLIQEAPVVIDGAWATQLQTRGLAPGECPDAWNLTRPLAVEEVARAYLDAGSRVILTNTFGANRVVLARHGLADRAVEINRAGARISRQAAAGRAHVFASVGPSGKMLMSGEIEESELRAVFVEQVRALAEGGADAIVVETMTDLAEAKLALAAAQEAGLPAVVSLVFDSGKNRDRTMMGATPEQAGEELTAAGADVIGANCGIGIESVAPICARLRASTDRPIWIKPNAGLPEMKEGRTVYRTTPEEFASHLPAVINSGAVFVGGCCGTSPDFIRAILRKIRT
ncbi:MAG: homocysteine S-methyltransferase family protein [Verrucomicrobia bacterium]|nr:homocysteine S-methyltransferase family protein [Verrucomicrobiota bacterium]